MFGADHCVIIGAGIAGLTTALALDQQGFSVLILEKADALQEVGAGLQLSPNATSVLEHLGVLSTLKSSASEIQSVDLNSAKNGKVLLSLKTNGFASELAPFLSVHRADLQAALLHHVRSRSGIKLCLGATYAGRQLTDQSMTIQFHDGTHSQSIQAQCLIGADGVNSKVRHLDGDHAADYSGYVASRQTVDRPELQSELLTQHHSVRAFLAPNAHLVVYPVSSGRKINIVYITKQPDFFSALSHRPVPTFDGFAPEIALDLANVGEWTNWPLFTVNTNEAWHMDERTILIGDAAHAMLPFAAQGAGMAIEDAFTLAHCLRARRPDVASALKNYEGLRRERVKQVVQRSKLNAFAYHAWGPVALARNCVFAFKGQRLMHELEWLYAYRVPGLS